MSSSVTKYVSRQLESLLGNYVDGVTEETLNLQLLGGKMKLSNLRIRETAFAELELPVRASGTVGTLELSVNLLRFWWNEPVVIVLKDVDIKLEPLHQGETMDPADHAAHFERIRVWKESQIHAINEKQENGDRKGSGFLARLAKKVRDNLQIHVHNFRIRWHDARAAADGRSHSIGLVLGSLVAESQQAPGPHDGAVEAEEVDTATKKVLEVRDFYLYVCPEDGTGEASMPKEYTAEALEEFLIVRPVHLETTLAINDKHQLQAPQYHFDFLLDRLELRIIWQQYVSLYKTLEEFTAYRSRLENWHWRPRQPPLKEPLQWFRYAGRCVQEQVHRKRFVAKHGERYVGMYQSHLLGQQSVEDRGEMRRLEKHMNAESIAALRLVAKSAAEAIMAAEKEAKELEKKQRSWGQWARSFVVASAPTGIDMESLDEETKQILSEALQQTSIGEEGMESNAFPREYGRFHFDFHVTLGSLTLVERGWRADEPARELAYMQFDKLDGMYVIRRDTYMYTLEVESFMLDDRKNSVAGLAQIASCRRLQPFSEGEAPKVLKWKWDTLPQTDSEQDGGSISIVLDGLCLVYSVECVLGVYGFWTVPKDDRFSRRRVEEAGVGAEAEGQKDEDFSVNRWLDRTRYEKKMAWAIDILQPRILFPADHKSAEEPVIVFEIERMHWCADSPASIKARLEADEASRFFDRNIMSLEKTSFRLVRNVEQWLHCLANTHTSWVMDEITIAEDFSFKVDWDICKLPEDIRQARSLQKYVLSGTIPAVMFSCTAVQYNDFFHTFFSVVKSHYAKPDSSEVEESAPVPAPPQPGQKPNLSSVIANFVFQDIQLKMLDKGSERRPLAQMVCAGFLLRYENGSKARLSFGMQKMEIAQVLESGELGSLFASSYDAQGGASEPARDFVRIERGWNAPDAVDHPGYDTWWDFAFCSLNLNWNDKTVSALLGYSSDAFRARSPVASDAAQAQEGTVAVEAAPAEEASPVKVRSRMSASMQLLSATLMRDGSKIARVAMTAAEGGSETMPGGSRTWGKLGNFVVEDLTKEDVHFREILGLRDKPQSVVEFEVRRYASGEEGYPGYDSAISLSMSSTRVVYVGSFIDELRRYIASEPLISGIMGKTASAVAESAKQAAGHHRRGQGLMKLDVKLVNPLLLLPVEEGRGKHLVADLGEITLENRFEAEGEERREHFEIGMRAMNLQEGGGGFLMERVDINGSGLRTLSRINAPGRLELKVRISEVAIALSGQQVRMCKRVVSSFASSVRNGDPEEVPTPIADEDGDDGDDDDTFHDASDIEPWRMRSTLNLSLECSSMVLSLRRSGSKGSGDVVCCKISEVASQYTSSTKGTESNLAILSIMVLDPGSDSREEMCFLTSTTSSSPGRHLMKARYESVAPDVVESQEYDRCLDLVFNSLEFNWNDSTVAALMNYAKEAFEELPPALPLVEKAQELGHLAPTPQEGAQALTGTEEGNQRMRTRITACVDLLGATLMRGTSKVARVAMNAAAGGFESTTWGSRTWGKLGNFVVEDLTKEDVHFREILGLRDKSQSVVEFELKRYGSGEEGYPGYDSAISLSMSSTRVVYVGSFVDELRRYIASEPLISGIMGKTASAVAESAKQAAGHHRRGQGLMKLDVKLVNPLLLLPVEEGRGEHLVADLGEITLENRFEAEGEERREHFEVGVRAMNLQEGGGGFLMEKVDVQLLGDRIMASAMSPVGKIIAHAELTNVQVNCSSRQFVLLRKVSSRWSSRLSPEVQASEQDQSSASVQKVSRSQSSWSVDVSLGGLGLSLLSNDSESSKEIVAVRVRNVKVAHVISLSKTEMTFSISALTIEDSTAANDEARLFVSSSSSQSPGKHLMKATYESISPDAKDHPGYDKWLDLAFSTLDLNWNDSTVAALMQYAELALKEDVPAVAAVVLEETKELIALKEKSKPSKYGAEQGRLKSRITACVDLLSATLRREGSTIARVAMTDAKGGFEAYPGSSRTWGKLGNFVVEDLTKEDVHFREILGLRDKSQSVVEFELKRYGSGEEGYPGYDSAISLSMSSTRVVYVGSFVDELRRYMASEPLISGIMGKTASAVAESAKQAAGHHRRGQGLMKLDVKLVNPLLLLPVEEGRGEHLVADLGEITLENRFEAEGEERREHFEVGVRAMNLQEGGGGFLMEKVDVQLVGERQLVSDTSLVPPLQLSAEVTDVTSHVTPHQIWLTNAMLSQTLFRQSTYHAPNQSSTPAAVVDANLGRSASASEASDASAPKAPPQIKIKATVTVSSVQLTLLDARPDGSPTPQTRLNMVNPSMTYRGGRKGETWMSCSIAMLEVVHEEAAREGQASHLLRYHEGSLTRATSDEVPSLPQVHFDYSKPSQDGRGRQLKISLFRPEIVILPESLVALERYFTDVSSLLEAKKVSGPLSQTPGTPVATKTPTATTPSTPLTPSSFRTSTSAMALVIEVRKPRICFVRQTAVGSGTSVVLQSTILMRGRITSDGAEFKSCSLASAEMFVSEEAGGEGHLRSLFDPFDVDIELAAKTEAGGDFEVPPRCLSVNVSTSIEAQVSYQDFVFAMLLWKSWQKAWAKRAELRRKVGTGAADDAQDGEAAGLGHVSSESESDSSPPPSVGKPPVPSYETVLRCKQVALTLINDCFSNSHMPVLEVRGTNVDFLRAVAVGTSVLEVSAGLEIDYFNMEVAEWEPFLEYWPICLSCAVMEPQHMTEWRLAASKPGAFNLTQAFLQCLSLNRRTINKAIDSFDENGVPVLPTSEGAQAQTKISIMHPYHIQNESGTVVVVSTFGMSWGAEAEPLDLTVQPGQCLPMDIRSSRKNQRRRLAQAHRVSIRIGSAWQPHVMRIDRVGKQNLVFQPNDPEGVPCKVVCNVKLVEGSKHVVMYSSVRVVNRTMHPFSMLFEPDGTQPQEGANFELSPEGTMSVPVQLVSHCWLRVQPSERHTWSAPLQLREPPRDAGGAPSAKTWLYNAGGRSGNRGADEGKGAFFVWIRVHSPNGFNMTITFTPILTLHNELAMPMDYRLHYGQSTPNSPCEVRGEIKPRGRVEHHSFSPEDAAYLFVRLPGFKWSTQMTRIQADRRLNVDAELHREIVVSDETDDNLALTMNITNVVVRSGMGQTGRDRHVTLFCPFWIKNMTGLPLAFCVSTTTPGYDGETVMPNMPAGTLASDMSEYMQSLLSDVESFGQVSSIMTQQPPSTSRAYTDTDTTMAGQRQFHRQEVERGSVTNGLIEQPLRGGDPRPDYPALMFSFGSRMKRNLFAKIPGSMWSERIPISDAGASGMVEIYTASDRGMLFQLSLSSQRIGGPYHQTHVLTFRPRFVIVNRLAHTVHFKQQNTSVKCVVRPQHKINFHWADSDIERELSIRLMDEKKSEDAASNEEAAGGADARRPRETAWSGGLDISALGETYVRLRSAADAASDTDEITIVRVEVRNVSETLYVILHHATKSLSPYRIHNLTSFELVVKQQIREFETERGPTDLIPPGESVPYAWDQPLERHILSVRVKGAEGGQTYELDAIRHHRSIGHGSKVLTASVFADGPTKVLRVIEKDAEGRMLVAPDVIAPQHDHKHQHGKSWRGRQHVRVNLSCVTVTLVNAVPQELLLFDLEHVEVEYMRVYDGAERFRSIDCRIVKCQVDNMLQRTPHPVVLHASDPTAADSPFCHIMLIEDLNVTSTKVPIVKKLQAEVQGMELRLEGRIAVLLYSYWLSCSALLKAASARQEKLDEEEAVVFAEGTGNRIYFELFMLPQVSLNLSFTRRDLAETDDVKHTHANEVSQRLTWLAASVDNAPLQLNSLVTKHVFIDVPTLMQLLREHYQKDCLRQFYKVIGSVEVLGNPVGLVRNLGTGLTAMRAGISGMRRGDSLKSLKDGAKIFAKHSAYGFSNSISKVSSSMSKGVATLAMDDGFLKEREERKDEMKCKPQSGFAGARTGGRDVYTSFASGLKGLMERPVDGYEKGGFVGMAEGLTLGLAGAVFKPASGVLDLISHTTEGIRNQTNVTGKEMAVRLMEPRKIDADRVLRPRRSAMLPHLELLERMAQQTKSLNTLGEPMREEQYYSHVVIKSGVVLLTDRHCVYAEYNTHAREGFGEPGYQAPLEPPQVKACVLAWHVPWADFGAAEVTGDSVTIQADPDAMATWDVVLIPDCGALVQDVCSVLHEGWRVHEG